RGLSSADNQCASAPPTGLGGVRLRGVLCCLDSATASLVGGIDPPHREGGTHARGCCASGVSRQSGDGWWSGAGWSAGGYIWSGARLFSRSDYFRRLVDCVDTDAGCTAAA